MKYTEWQQLTESFGARSLGLSNRQVIGGPVGSRLQESPFDLKNKKDLEDEDELEDEELEDEEGEGGEDLLGDEPEGPEKDFPPDDSEDMDGLPTPEEELGDEMDDTLAGIDPDLAGLGDDEMGGEMPPEMGDMGGEEEMAPELGDMEPEMGDEMGMEMEPELGDEMGLDMEPEMGDEMGDEMGLEPEMGDEMGAAEVPCMDCNPEGEMEEGDPECATCGGEGFVTDDQAEMPEEPGDVDAELVDDDPEAEMMDLMARMQSYCKRYMPSFSTKYMDKDGKTDCCEDGKGDCCKKENNEFLDKLAKNALGIKEDALLTPEEPEESAEPEVGEVGFAPQGRIGSIGGGYTMSDFQDIPTLGESVNYPTWHRFLSKKEES